MWSYKCHEIGYEIAKPKTAEAKEVILFTKWIWSRYIPSTSLNISIHEF